MKEREGRSRRRRTNGGREGRGAEEVREGKRKRGKGKEADK